METRKTDIVLTVVPPWDCEKPPLGAASLATYLKSAGLSVEVMDMNIELYHRTPVNIRNRWNGQEVSFWLENEFIAKYNKDFQDYIEKILSYECKIFGFSINTSVSVYFLKELIIQIKKRKPDKMVAVGGPGCFFRQDREIFTAASVDFFVIGKGEFALEWLMRNLAAGNSLKGDEKCSVTKEENGSYCIEWRQKYSLDALPFPTFEEFKFSLYTQKILPVGWSQGCIRTCAFCLDKIFSGAYNPGSVSRAVSGIKFYIDTYGINSFRFIDNLINGDLRRLSELCDSIINEDLPIYWDGQVAVRSDMDRGIFTKLKMAKCGRLELGVESFSDKVLSAMHKGFKADDAIQNIIDAKEAGLKVAIFIIVGFPQEEEADFEETIENIRKYREYLDEIGNLTLCSIPSGTDMYLNPDKYNIAVGENKNLKEFWLKWRTKDNSNNFQIRLKRFQKLKRVLDEFKITYKDNLDPVEDIQ
jgi:radical SAM superfamily enzyme YgiQ (UPF0313 family)